MRESEVKKEAAIELRVFGSFSKIEPLWPELEGWQDHPSLWPAFLSAMEETAFGRSRRAGCRTTSHSRAASVGARTAT